MPISGKKAVRDAATVMLVRDGAEGLEVFMVRRSPDADFVGGGYVFPGGRVEEGDRRDDLEDVCAGRTERAASSALGVPSGGLAFWVAAIRECFEEAGILLAYDRGGRLLSFGDACVAERYAALRHKLNHGTDQLVRVCRDEGIRLATDRLHYFSHWIAPEGAPKRFSTRFFVAAAPPAQRALHDNQETVDHVWVRPVDALERHRRGEYFMIFPTIKHLEALSAYGSADALLAESSQRREVTTVQPRIVKGEKGIQTLLPGDPGYEAAVAPVLP